MSKCPNFDELMSGFWWADVTILMSRCHKIVMSRCPMSKCITTIRQQRIHKTKDLNRAVLFPFTSPAPQSTSFCFQRYATAIFLPHFSWAHKVVLASASPFTNTLTHWVFPEDNTRICQSHGCFQPNKLAKLGDAIAISTDWPTHPLTDWEMLSHLKNSWGSSHFHCTLYIFIAHCTFSLHIAHITPSLKRWLVFGHFSTVTTERNMVCSPNKSNRTFPQIWWKSVVVQEWRFPLKWNMKSSRNKSNRTFPQIWGSQWGTLQLWGGFLTLCEQKKHPEAHPKVNSDAWEG